MVDCDMFEVVALFHILFCSVWLDRLVGRKVEIADFQSLYATTVTYSQLKHMATRYGSRLPSIIRHVSNCDPGDAE
jgi:hypothetical protein